VIPHGLEVRLGSLEKGIPSGDMGGSVLIKVVDKLGAPPIQGKASKLKKNNSQTLVICEVRVGPKVSQ